MITERFNLLELTDLALRFPEVGAVNFNILRTVIRSLILELQLEGVKPPCYIENEALAQAALTKARIADPQQKKVSKVLSTSEMKEKFKKIDGHATDEQSQTSDVEPPTPIKDTDTTEDTEEPEAPVTEVPLESDRDTPEQEADDVPKLQKPDEVPGSQHQQYLPIPTEEEILEAEPAELVTKIWRATNIDRRMQAAEKGLTEMAEFIDHLLDKVEDIENRTKEALNNAKAMWDEITKFLDRIKELEDSSKTLSRRLTDTNEIRAAEVERLEGINNELKQTQEETQTAVEELSSRQKEMSERVAYKEDLEALHDEMSNELEAKGKEIKKLIYEVEETLVTKVDFMELVSRTDSIEETKVNREELGRLLEPGFIDNFLEEQANLRTELDEMKLTISKLEENLNELLKRIEEEIISTMKTNFADIRSMLDIINAKLATLDADEINDSFLNLEEKTDLITKELQEMRAEFEHFRKEANKNFSKMSNVDALLERLENTKMDKAKTYELLGTKADIDMIKSKLDRKEFVIEAGIIKDDLERLTIQVKINEEEMNRNKLENRQEWALKMYTEDFITGTEPIRNRIKAMMYEIKCVKKIALTHLFPDAPGIVKCFSCSRGANLAGPKYMGDANVELLQEVPPSDVSNRKIPPSKRRLYSPPPNSPESPSLRLPPTDDTDDTEDDIPVPIPPPDQLRETDINKLPVLFAKARPQIGLAHEKRKKDIDNELAAYFATKPTRACGGEYTLIAPQQRGVTFTAVTIPQPEKEEILLKGIDNKLYRCAIYDGQFGEDTPEPPVEKLVKEDKPKEKPIIPSLKEPKVKKGFRKPDLSALLKKKKPKAPIVPTVVSLHVDGEAVQETANLYKPS